MDFTKKKKFEDAFKNAGVEKCDEQTVLLCKNGLGYLVPQNTLMEKYKYLLVINDSSSIHLRRVLGENYGLEIDDQYEEYLKNCV